MEWENERVEEVGGEGKGKGGYKEGAGEKILLGFEREGMGKGEEEECRKGGIGGEGWKMNKGGI